MVSQRLYCVLLSIMISPIANSGHIRGNMLNRMLTPYDELMYGQYNYQDNAQNSLEYSMMNMGMPKLKLGNWYPVDPEIPTDYGNYGFGPVIFPAVNPESYYDYGEETYDEIPHFRKLFSKHYNDFDVSMFGKRNKYPYSTSKLVPKPLADEFQLEPVLTKVFNSKREEKMPLIFKIFQINFKDFEANEFEKRNIFPDLISEPTTVQRLIDLETDRVIREIFNTKGEEEMTSIFKNIPVNYNVFEGNTLQEQHLFPQLTSDQHPFPQLTSERATRPLFNGLKIVPVAKEIFNPKREEKMPLVFKFFTINFNDLRGNGVEKQNTFPHFTPEHVTRPLNDDLQIDTITREMFNPEPEGKMPTISKTFPIHYNDFRQNMIKKTDTLPHLTLDRAKSPLFDDLQTGSVFKEMFIPERETKMPLIFKFFPIHFNDFGENGFEERNIFPHLTPDYSARHLSDELEIDTLIRDVFSPQSEENMPYIVKKFPINYNEIRQNTLEKPNTFPHMIPEPAVMPSHDDLQNYPAITKLFDPQRDGKMPINFKTFPINYNEIKQSATGKTNTLPHMQYKPINGLPFNDLQTDPSTRKIFNPKREMKIPIIFKKTPINYKNFGGNSFEERNTFSHFTPEHAPRPQTGDFNADPFIRDIFNPRKDETMSIIFNKFPINDNDFRGNGSGKRNTFPLLTSNHAKIPTTNNLNVDPIISKMFQLKRDEKVPILFKKFPINYNDFRDNSSRKQNSFRQLKSVRVVRLPTNDLQPDPLIRKSDEEMSPNNGKGFQDMLFEKRNMSPQLPSEWVSRPLTDDLRNNPGIKTTFRQTRESNPNKKRGYLRRSKRN